MLREGPPAGGRDQKELCSLGAATWQKYLCQFKVGSLPVGDSSRVAVSQHLGIGVPNNLDKQQGGIEEAVDDNRQVLLSIIVCQSRWRRTQLLA